MKTLIFLRHGKTTYSGKFPDLTDEGKQEIGQAADHIAELIAQRGIKDIQIVSSPAPRALGTADIIAKRLGFHDGEAISQELAIRSMDFYDAEGAANLWKGFASAREVDKAYATDPRFESGEVIEARSAIQYRFFKYLGGLIERLLEGKLPDVLIHTTHFEVLWYLASLFGFKEPLVHGEVIRFDLQPCDHPMVSCNELVDVRGVFREMGKEFECLAPTAAFRTALVRSCRGDMATVGS